MSTIELSRTYWEGIDGRTVYGSVDTTVHDGMLVGVAVENPNYDEYTRIEVELTPAEARQLAAELVKLANEIEGR